MRKNVEITEVSSVVPYIDQLSELLKEVVDGGASIGFLPPLDLSEARSYWETVLAPDVRLIIAMQDSKIAGTVQVHLCMKQNGSHRAEIAKLMTHPAFRRLGIARLLMEKAEEIAVREKRSLLVLDTRKGDPSNLLYQSLGYIQAGEIPYFAQSLEGTLDTTVLYYKTLGKEMS
ncbi:GNAT family N-acetyltransferase [Bacillus sp. PS06]|uniref:GNAT family N-acetyltransferase n=1 Tax=Bacillus sp. PS06 TaxID=2764176 RepID=UPI00178705D7|nr:GNAT family N-acetyltransferase [Bacillus sp. PS06]MBD8071087.1 GNAT family N-acetyltransferase [Bacillus sp. PS06]